MQALVTYFRKITPFVVASALIIALASYLFDLNLYTESILSFVLLFFSVPIWIDIFLSVRKGHLGVDIIAGLALATAFLFKEYIAGSIVLLMLSGGEALEVYAANKARKALTNLLSLIPSKAHVKTENGIKDVDSKYINTGTLIIVKAGEVIPVDGSIVGGESFVDESIMTGEAMPVRKSVGSAVFAGTTNTDTPIEIKTVKPLSESRLEGIIDIVRRAEEEKAPFVRMADKYSVYFTLITLIMASGAWIISGDPIRLLAVLVIATPCPLILATPIAFLSGMSAMSKRGVIVKSGSALEKLSQVNIFVFDKTGTVTLGAPKVHSVHVYGDKSMDECIRIAASLDQLSVHVLASSLVKYAKNTHKLKLSYPEYFREKFGDGVEGIVDGTKYFFGKLKFIEENGVKIDEGVKSLYTQERTQGIAPVYLSTENKLVGSIYFQDEIRSDANNLFVKLRNNKKRTILLTGDKELVASHVAAALRIDSFKADATPEEKLLEVQGLQDSGNFVAMIGDGVNDAPALARAHVGIALGSHGSTAASETADMVIISSSVGRVYDALKISEHSVSVARKGIFIGIGLSTVGMIFALFGFIPPFAGALVQEAIDITVILYALRAGFVKNVLI